MQDRTDVDDYRQGYMQNRDEQDALPVRSGLKQL